MPPPNENNDLLCEIEERYSALLQRFLAPIHDELAALRYLASILDGTNTRGVSCPDRGLDMHIACQVVNSIFTNKAAVSRFVAHCTMKELARTGTPFETSSANPSQPSDSCPALLLAALSFSQFSSARLDTTQSKRSLITSPVGKKHVYLQRSIVGSAFLSMANDHIVRWKDSTMRNAGL